MPESAQQSSEVVCQELTYPGALPSPGDRTSFLEQPTPQRLQTANQAPLPKQ